MKFINIRRETSIECLDTLSGIMPIRVYSINTILRTITMTLYLVTRSRNKRETLMNLILRIDLCEKSRNFARFT